VELEEQVGLGECMSRVNVDMACIAVQKGVLQDTVSEHIDAFTHQLIANWRLY
jgi:hypothetical protein